ncbi:MAG: phosphotransferase family protein [Thermomicrobiales bacterium]
MNGAILLTIPEKSIEAIVTRAYGHETSLQAAQPVGGGSVNDVIALTFDHEPAAILRIAPSAEQAASGPSWLTSFGLRREQAIIALLPHLAHLLPETVHADFSRTLLDRDWVIQSFVRGTSWSELAASMTEKQHANVWHQTGSLARSIHVVRDNAFGLPNDGEAGTRSPQWSDVLLYDAEGFLADAGRFGIDPGPFERLHAVITHHAGTLDVIAIPGMIHSDLDPRHIFLEPDGNREYRISGLIDLEFGRFADPLSESLIVQFAFDPNARAFADAFWQGYGSFPLAPGDDLRSLIYQGIALSWVLTDLARLQRHTELAEVTSALNARLRQLETR